MKLKNLVTGEEKEATVQEILEMINADRSDKWEEYDETDWHEGLQWTDWEIVEYSPKVWEMTVEYAVIHVGKIEAENLEDAKLIGKKYFRCYRGFFESKMKTNETFKEITE